eukprot:m.52369 g.52369  ORF g.52369 m.52369 type:complete len:327 (+) comp6687_c0_seq2:228-1208(+)
MASASESDVVYQSFVTKRGHSYKSWKRRWLVLTADRVLRYYKLADKDVCDGAPSAALGKPLGSIALSAACSAITHENCTEVEWPEQVPPLVCFGIVTPERVYFVVADSLTSADRWCSEINDATGGKEAVPFVPSLSSVSLSTGSQVRPPAPEGRPTVGSLVQGSVGQLRAASLPRQSSLPESQRGYKPHKFARQQSVPAPRAGYPLASPPAPTQTTITCTPPRAAAPLPDQRSSTLPAKMSLNPHITEDTEDLARLTASQRKKKLAYAQVEFEAASKGRPPPRPLQSGAKAVTTYTEVMIDDNGVVMTGSLPSKSKGHRHVYEDVK